ncbi:unnamed protein product, partial [marine sediment metagenome]
ILNNATTGLSLFCCTYSVIINNTCENNNDRGIELSYSDNSTVINNTCNNNDRGIDIWSSDSSTVANNTFTNCGLKISEETIDAYLSYTVENNWVNEKPLGFYTNLDSTIIAEPVYGQLILANCTNVIVRDQILNNATTGLSLFCCTYSVIINNTCNNNVYDGIYLYSSGSSTVTNNTCENNNFGIYLLYSGSSTVTNNTCKNNNNQGIDILFSDSSTVANNTFTNCGLKISEETIDAYLSYTVEDNRVNGKKLGFYTNLDSTIIDEPVYGQLILANCTNVIVR